MSIYGCTHKDATWLSLLLFGHFLQIMLLLPSSSLCNLLHDLLKVTISYYVAILLAKNSIE